MVSLQMPFILIIFHGAITRQTNGQEYEFNFSSMGEKNYRKCPPTIEIDNSNREQFLDFKFLESLCKNASDIERLKISGRLNGIAESLFNKLPKLEDFQANDIENLTELSVSTWNLKLLDLSRNSMGKVTVDFMDNLIHLNLSYNELTDETIVMTSLRSPLSPKLRILDLSHNNLTKLDSLFSFWNLRKFLLNDNQIVSIKPGILQRYPNLVTLNIARNKLFTLSDGMFIGLIHLVSLDLSFNELSDVNIENINSLRSLEFLDMTGNDINEFDPDQLDHHLEILRINEYHTYIQGKRVESINNEENTSTTTTEISSSMFTDLE